ncbi:hypothetical protein GGR54DRAFT_606855 [Hypoxylon sp. NC1633]|nr:hypothetical protein GGR54DRAFT_606855 [Hypoxylon sp. NC1633]
MVPGKRFTLTLLSGLFQPQLTSASANKQPLSRDKQQEDPAEVNNRCPGSLSDVRTKPHRHRSLPPNTVYFLLIPNSLVCCMYELPSAGLSSGFLARSLNRFPGSLVIISSTNYMMISESIC